MLETAPRARAGARADVRCGSRARVKESGYANPGRRRAALRIGTVRLWSDERRAEDRTRSLGRLYGQVLPACRAAREGRGGAEEGVEGEGRTEGRARRG